MDAIVKYDITKSYTVPKKTALMTCTTTNPDLSWHYCHLNTVGHRKISLPWFLSCPACSLHNQWLKYSIQVWCKWLWWSRGSVLAFSTQVRGFKPCQSCRIFKGEKILSTPSFGEEVKPSFPCRRFAACKRSLNGTEVVISAKLPHNILVHSSHFRRWDLSRRSGRGSGNI